jgi:hypothetical protein
LKWDGLRLADRFEAFLTVDQNIEFQQNVKASGVAVIVVVARTNRLRELRPLARKILDALNSVKAGAIMRVGADATHRESPG